MRLTGPAFAEVLLHPEDHSPAEIRSAVGRSGITHAEAALLLGTTEIAARYIGQVDAAGHLVTLADARAGRVSQGKNRRRKLERKARRAERLTQR